MDKQENKLFFIFLSISILIVFLFYAHTLNYPWKYFDEQIIYNETVFPQARSIPEIFEYLKYFGLNHHFEASSPFYSSIANLRCDPANTFMTIIVYYLFQKKALLFHLLSLIFHILNACLLFNLLNIISVKYLSNLSPILKLTFISALTLIWALHPLNTESILFTANWAALISYFFCLLTIYYFLKVYSISTNAINSFIIFLIYLFPLFTTEYSITVPLILFFYTFSLYRSENKGTSLIDCLKFSFKKIVPILIALIIFIIHFTSSETRGNISYSTGNTITLTLERVLWLSPQILWHFIKLISLPLNLSIDQTSMVNIANSYFHPHAVFCMALSGLLIILLFISFLNIKKNPGFFFLISLCPFLIALLPFLHIISPTYCLSSERYLYFPLLMLVFGISHVLFFCLTRLNDTKKAVLIIIAVFLLLITLGTKTYVRTFDWKDSVSLFTSSLNSTNNKLFKSLRTAMLGSLYSQNARSQIYGFRLLNDAVVMLEKYIADLGQHNNSVPQILKFYGLDPDSLQLKAAYLLTSTKLGINTDIIGAYEILKPYVNKKYIQALDTQILDLYLGILFQLDKLAEAEQILNESIKKRLNPTILVIMSELQKRKYNDLNKAEMYLQKSFKYFPYDVQTLDALKKIYLISNKDNDHGYFSYLHGIRTHSLESLENAYNVFIALNNSEMANKSFKSIKLIRQQ